MVAKRAAGFWISLMGMIFHHKATKQPDPAQNTVALLDPEDPPPPPPPAAVSSPRLRLSDGRYLAYMEKGVPRNKANHKIIIVHGFGSSKEMNFQVPEELIDELGIYLLLFDRAGYGESDPNPMRSLKSEAFDIQELADQLSIGSKFYVIGVSMGSYPTWGCLKYIPERQTRLCSST